MEASGATPPEHDAAEAAAQADAERAKAAAEAAPSDANEHAPVAAAADKAIVGDSGMFEQQPQPSAGSPDQVHRTSSPPPQVQSGVPLPEDRAAGVTPGTPGIAPPPGPPAQVTA